MRVPHAFLEALWTTHRSPFPEGWGSPQKLRELCWVPEQPLSSSALLARHFTCSGRETLGSVLLDLAGEL